MPMACLLVARAITLFNSNLDFDSSGGGLATGLSYRLADALSVGMHFDFSFANLETDGSTHGDSVGYSLGAHADYFISS